MSSSLASATSRTNRPRDGVFQQGVERDTLALIEVANGLEKEGFDTLPTFAGTVRSGLIAIGKRHHRWWRGGGLNSAFCDVKGLHQVQFERFQIHLTVVISSRQKARWKTHTPVGIQRGFDFKRSRELVHPSHRGLAGVQKPFA